MKIKLSFFILLLATSLFLIMSCCKKEAPVTPKMMADFKTTRDTVLVGDEVQFLDLSTDDPLAWKWLFGDGTSSDEQYPTHAYAEAGKYDVYLKAINDTDSAFVLKNEAITVVDILTTNPMLSEFDLWVDENIMKAYDNPAYSGVSIAFIEQDEAYKYHYGVKKRGTYDIADDDTYYQLASITKPFTALAVLQWLAEKNISLDSSVVSFLPQDCAQGLSLNGIDITFRHLLSHDSGLPAWSFDFDRADCTFDDSDSAKVYNFLSNNDLSREPGRQSLEYSNLGFSILGLILERQTGKSLQQVYNEYIFDELGMSATVLEDPETLENIALTYGGLNGFTDNPCNETFYKLDGAYNAAAGLISNLEDMTMFCQFLIASENGTGLLAAKNSSFEKQYDLPDVSICLSWFGTESTSGDMIYEIGGELSGMSAFLIVNPTKGRAVVFFTNYWISDQDWGQMVDMAKNYVDDNISSGRIEPSGSSKTMRH